MSVDTRAYPAVRRFAGVAEGKCVRGLIVRKPDNAGDDLRGVGVHNKILLRFR